MAWPASQQTLDDALTQTSSTANKIKSLTQTIITDSLAGDVPRRTFVDLQRRLQAAITAWNNAAAVPGIVQYARDQYDNQTIDIAAEFIAMRSAAESLRDWIFNNIPTDPTDGAVRLETISQFGVFTPIMVTTAQSAGFRTEANAFVATIG
jgi:hypothetical protein